MLDHPLEYTLIAFKGNKRTGKVVPELLDLAERGIVRYVDIVFIEKDKDGSARTVELNDLDDEAYKMFVPMGEHVSSLFTEDDLQIAASKLRKNTSALLLLWENLWADNIRKALVDAGGSLVERGHISEQVVKQFKKELAAEERKVASSKKKASAKKQGAAKKAATKKK